MPFKLSSRLIRDYIHDIRGLAFVESALILPMMVTLLLGLYDLGQAVIVNQKVTAASHMAADLVTRKVLVNSGDMQDALAAAHMVIDPFERTPLGIDIVGIQFDEDDSPETIWRYTHNMTETASLPTEADGLGVHGEGVVAVSVIYEYRPFFSGPLVGPVTMEEISFMRGRRNSFIRYEDN